MKPEEKKLVSCKWVFWIKDSLLFDELNRYKARLIAKGFTQKVRINYSENFPPATRYGTIRIMLALTTYCDWELE